MSASEVLTDETRGRLRSAFGVEPTNVYGATETAGIASECRHGRLHRYEDLVIAEIVDEDNRPVAPGEFGAKLLVTVLFSRTQPLIRYEMSDRVQALVGACPDGLPYALIGGVEGREEEVLTLAGVTVHPNVFHRALERLDVAGWQVIEEGGRLRILLARPASGLDPAAVGLAVTSALESVGVRGIAIDIRGRRFDPADRPGQSAAHPRGTGAPASRRSPMNEMHDGGEHPAMSHDRHAGHSVAMFRDKFWLSLALTIPVLIWSGDPQHWLGYTAPGFPGSALIPPVFGTIVFVYGGLVFLRGARGELAGRQPGMMTLISLAIVVAFVTSWAGTLGLFEVEIWWELATLITIMLLGHWLEMRSIAQARGALSALAELLPDTAERVNGSGTQTVPLSALAVGDIVLVRPGARVPADGVVAEGSADVDESMITGESKTVAKEPGDAVVAGTVAAGGSLRVRVSAVGEETALSGIMRMVAAAQASASRAQALADRAAAILFYVALGAGVVTLVFWWIAGDPEGALVRTATVSSTLPPRSDSGSGDPDRHRDPISRSRIAWHRPAAGATRAIVGPRGDPGFARHLVRDIQNLGRANWLPTRCRPQCRGGVALSRGGRPSDGRGGDRDEPARSSSRPRPSCVRRPTLPYEPIVADAELRRGRSRQGACVQDTPQWFTDGNGLRMPR